jgi:uncharacterized protein (DUF433 family)
MGEGGVGLPDRGGEGVKICRFNPCPSVFIRGSILCGLCVPSRPMSGLQSFSTRRIVHDIGMKTKANGHRTRVELGRHVVADSAICGGQPTFKGTRIMVWIVLEQLEDGLTWAEIAREWDDKVGDEAIAEAIAIADLVVKHEPFKGFHVGARRKSTRRAAALAA